MQTRWQLLIPYRQPSYSEDVSYGPGELRLHHYRDGTLFLPVRESTQYFGRERRTVSPAPVAHLGKATRAEHRPEGLWLLLQLDRIEAREMIPEYLENRYYGRPVVNGGYVDVLEVGGLETWATAQLKLHKAAVGLPAGLEPVPREWLGGR